MPMEVMIVIVHFMLYLSTIGFGMALANAFIGLSHFKSLKELTLVEIKAHKLNGRLAVSFFYLLAIMCLIFGLAPLLTPGRINEVFLPTVFFHELAGGVIAFILITTKFLIARYKKDFIYDHGRIIGPIGLTGWALAYFSSNIDFYFHVNPDMGLPTPVLIPNYLISILFSILIGIILFVSIKAFNYKTYGGAENQKNLHGVAMILHGITFGYEGSAKELIGTPVLYKYVFPKTYAFLVRYAESIGLDMEDLKKRNLNEAMHIAMDRFAEIGMAEKIKIDWHSDNEFTVESINCSTSVVRSLMAPEELENSICPWGILAATIAYTITGKEIEIGFSEFNKIGAKSKLKIIDK
jgi:hypothetical protein